MVDIATEACEAYPGVVGWRAARAWSLALLGEMRGCERDFGEICRVGIERIPRRMDWAVTMAFLAEVACALRARDMAEPILEALMPLRGRTILLGLCVASWGCASRYLGKLAGLLGRMDDASALLKEAVEIDDATGARAWAARSRYELAFLMRSSTSIHSDRKRRLEQLRDQAASTAAELGLVDLRTRLAGLDR
jgi:hypothetical protein